MATCEPDPDVVRWGLDLLGGDSFSSSGDRINATQLSDATLYEGINATESQLQLEPSNVESDEVIAHALQEEFSHLAAVEASGDSQPAEDHLQAILAQDWLGPSCQISGEVAQHMEEREETNHEQEASPCPSPERSQNDLDDAYAYPEFSDEFCTLDGEVSKRLTQMNSVPHVPRINGDIPSVDEATSDHQRLLGRLELYDLSEFKIPGDGNCQFRALSDQFYRTPEHHKFIRQQVVNQLNSNREMYEGYVPMPYDEYLKKIAKSGEWGDHVTLQAAADCYGVKICVVTSFKDTCFIEILPKVQHSKRVIFLSFWAEVHYNSIYPEGDIPNASEMKRKKSWWLFGSRH
ncbi:OVARIAN TUMOR DOMAIN-containing deubiquitinating enzyme 12 [Cryptomeria japonica]|uniref:OVARIAN TUMOR DOMAIN-containing deubiquitinating enzyme 12 n=1 Tax=Cryptomeria japonica TaxID=3369 RepID=UPI0025ABC2B7|nr:OVARIAN TUMOR DOMAIN-containing deubiquitinating enzyme 12 [Cryptomeria japonica]